WDAREGVTISRGAAAARELERREDELLDNCLQDTSGHLLETLGPPPPDPAGQVLWRGRARHRAGAGHGRAARARGPAWRRHRVPRGAGGAGGGSRPPSL